MRLICRAELPRALALGIGDGRPAPAVLLDERATLLLRVSDVEPEKRELGMVLLERCEGDRPALAGASPGRPDVDEHLRSAQGGERGVLAVERGAFDRRCSWALGGVSGAVVSVTAQPFRIS